jgi:hypothetical protein
MIKSRRVRWARRVARSGENKNIYTGFWWENPKEKRQKVLDVGQRTVSILGK